MSPTNQTPNSSLPPSEKSHQQRIQLTSQAPAAIELDLQQSQGHRSSYQSRQTPRRTHLASTSQPSEHINQITSSPPSARTIPTPNPLPIDQPTTNQPLSRTSALKATASPLQRSLTYPTIPQSALSWSLVTLHALPPPYSHIPQNPRW